MLRCEPENHRKCSGRRFNGGEKGGKEEGKMRKGGKEGKIVERRERGKH